MFVYYPSVSFQEYLSSSGLLHHWSCSTFFSSHIIFVFCIILRAIHEGRCFCLIKCVSVGPFLSRSKAKCHCGELQRRVFTFSCADAKADFWIIYIFTSIHEHRQTNKKNSKHFLKKCISPFMQESSIQTTLCWEMYQFWSDLGNIIVLNLMISQDVTQSMCC